MLFEIKNALLREVTAVTSGTSKSGNDWTRATVVLEKVEGNYTDTYPLLAFGERIQEAEALVGCAVDVKFNIQAREYNGRWFVDLGLRSVTESVPKPEPAQPKAAKPAPKPAPAPAKEDDPDGDLPF